MNKPSAIGDCRGDGRRGAGIYWTSGQSRPVLMNLSQAGDELSDG